MVKSGGGGGNHKTKYTLSQNAIILQKQAQKRNIQNILEPNHMANEKKNRVQQQKQTTTTKFYSLKSRIFIVDEPTNEKKYEPRTPKQTNNKFFFI
ncbi:Forkhead box protein P4, variant 2 [Dermatophagoides farinae]|uniref:Forkhead box protein P4, variant 2 n=1 Tax=Dermatophagoides farinae TaxID=6954 RepID=A0A922LCV4_DERFA|nr:Forkhead box protein P4, variant 2 [Dermatophagoides farinae]